MSNLDLVSMCPAVPSLVSSRFGVSPVGGADMALHHCGGSSWCRRGWDSSGVHLCNGDLDLGNGFGERCVGGYQVLNGGVL